MRTRGWALALSAVAERSMQERLEELERRRQAALHAGSESAVERQHSRREHEISLANVLMTPSTPGRSRSWTCWLAAGRRG